MVPFLPHQNDASTASVSLRSMHGLVGGELKITTFGGTTPVRPRDSSCRVHAATYTAVARFTHARSAAWEKPLGQEAAVTTVGVGVGVALADGLLLSEGVALPDDGSDELVEAEGASEVGAVCCAGEVHAARASAEAAATTAVRRTTALAMPRG